jgi:nitrite reductase/ring-hydroxylating ferredoxin subunit
METRVALRLQDVPQGALLKVETEAGELLVVNLRGSCYALEARCPHGQGNLWEGTLDGDVLVCPTHGARFDVRTGRLLKPRVNYYGLPYGGPATRDLKTYAVSVNDGEMIIHG